MNTLATRVNAPRGRPARMRLCQCNICLRERARVIVALADRGIKDWWYHRATINRAAALACERARAEGYVDDPDAPYPRGIPA